MFPLLLPDRRVRRAGLSLAELMLAMAVLTMVASIVATMALSVQTASNYTRGHRQAVQHARVALDRIDRTLRAATISESFPGFTVVRWSDSGHTFPDTLVVWRPAGAAVDPAGLPRANELLIVRPDPTNPAILLEITNPSEPATITYAASDLANWQALVQTLTSRTNAVKTELTGMLRTAPVTALSSTRRAALRFRASAAPTAEELIDYRTGTATWSSLSWPQDRRGRTMGLRGLACFVEMQLAPDETIDSNENVLPFFGSTVIWKEVTR